LRSRAEIARSADVDDEEDGQLAFLRKFLHEGTPGAGGDVPVDGPDFVAAHIFADLVEVEAPALEDRLILASQRIGHLAAGADFELPHFFHNGFGSI
jgi:hypothetical protein